MVQWRPLMYVPHNTMLEIADDGEHVYLRSSAYPKGMLIIPISEWVGPSAGNRVGIQPENQSGQLPEIGSGELSAQSSGEELGHDPETEWGWWSANEWVRTR